MSASAPAGPNMGALQSMNLANQGGSDPKAYPGAFAFLRGAAGAGLKDDNEVGVKGFGSLGAMDILGGATGDKSTNPLRKIFSEIFHVKDLWSMHDGGGAGAAAKSAASAEASHMAGAVASGMAGQILNNSTSHNNAHTSSSSDSSSSNNSSSSSGSSGSNHSFSAVGSAAQGFVASGATYAGNVSPAQYGQLSPSTSQGKGQARGAGAGMGT